MSKIISFIKELVVQSFAIANDDSKQHPFSRRTRRVADIVVIACMILAMMLVGWCLLPCVGYGIASILKHIGEGVGAGDSWFLYEVGDVFKSALIANNDVAQFLNDCAGTHFGKLVQIFILMVSQVVFWGWFCYTLSNVCEIFDLTKEIYLVNHKESHYYARELENFLAEYKSRDYDYDDMLNAKYYYIFASEVAVMRLLQAKYIRMCEEERRYH